ncbi:hypothetical protein EJ02DRAFT_148512 [Clathrospora elynae]|uniref:Uncharacterized protein n=1 Tax=Clathrospora elynae TaxID=706981 RepID=A0A6A5SX53_9PLEO|nr:hypothetical protein EJ02DRAFT_148512 [Clathrospora elynae]
MDFSAAKYSRPYYNTAEPAVPAPHCATTTSRQSDTMPTTTLRLAPLTYLPPALSNIPLNFAELGKTPAAYFRFPMLIVSNPVLYTFAALTWIYTRIDRSDLPRPLEASLLRRPQSGRARAPGRVVPESTQQPDLLAYCQLTHECDLDTKLPRRAARFTRTDTHECDLEAQFPRRTARRCGSASPVLGQHAARSWLVRLRRVSGRVFEAALRRLW